jgi:hypothetical protein
MPCFELLGIRNSQSLVRVHPCQSVTKSLISSLLPPVKLMYLTRPKIGPVFVFGTGIMRPVLADFSEQIEGKPCYSSLFYLAAVLAQRSGQRWSARRRKTRALMRKICRQLCRQIYLQFCLQNCKAVRKSRCQVDRLGRLDQVGRLEMRLFAACGLAIFPRA